MKKFIYRIYYFLENSNFFYRKFILLATDQFIICIALAISFLNRNLYYKNPLFIFTDYYYIFFLAVIVYLFTGQYRGLTKYYDSSSFYKIAFRNLLLGLIIYSLNFILNFSNFLPLNSIIFFLFISSSLSFLLRISLGWLIKTIQYENKKSNKVVIYGAGEAGAQLLSSLKFEKTYKVLFFIDDNKSLWGRSLNSIPIKSPDFLYKTRSKIDKVLLAIPSLKKNRRTQILEELSKLSITINLIPSIQELISGKEKIDTLRPITIDELLGREPVKPMIDVIARGINNMNVCITGAGGSIGSELCKQILNFAPAKLVLIDNSEANLYQIGIEIEKNYNPDFPLVLKLGDSTNSKFINSIFKKSKIDIVFHAAAYKHVPIVEDNPISGIFNNVISTLTVCEASLKNNLKKMILISTDKAVRPTNIMGASKRLAEQIVLEYSKNKYHNNGQDIKNNTCFSLVRFGNVLGSSGSVVPLFSKQIKDGGPVTITHKNITRYFMTLTEAAQLVLHVTGISQGGEVFLLDMGKPVSIQYLAEQMIKLSGLKVKINPNSKEGVEIKYTGLRPGEKLYEELLIDSNAEKTIHPLIFKGVNENTSCSNLLSQINLLKEKIINLEENESLRILSNLVTDWDYSKKFD